jgi:tripartite-type tricarboxylate transporter receptor subunit TctC
MKTTRRLILSAAAVALALAATTPFAAAKWPMDKTITMVVPWPAGSGVDLVARILADGIQKKWGATVVVENRVGASGNIAQNFVAKAAPDGYTLLVTTPGPAANNMLTFKSLPYNPLTDFSFITTTNEDPLIIVAGPRLKAKDMKEFIAYVKANKGQLQFANPGHGTYAHMAQLSLQELIGAEFNLIPYKGSPQMATDMIGGQIDAAMDLIGSYMEQVRAGKLRILAVAGDKRIKELPDVPTLKEVGINFTAQPWFGFEGPKGMDKQIIADLNKLATDVLADPVNAKKLTDVGTTPRTMSPAEFEKLVKDEVEKWRPIIVKYKITSE